MEEDVELEIAVAGCGKGAVGGVEMWQEWRHILVG